MQTKQAAYEKAKKYIESGMPTTKAFKKAKISAPSYYTYKKRDSQEIRIDPEHLMETNAIKTLNINLTAAQARIVELENQLNKSDQKNQSLVHETNQSIKILQAQKADLEQRIIASQEMIGLLKDMLSYQKQKIAVFENV